ncbi:MAG: FCD domain-containing protein [Treponema sp.]|nr:FCD domain-containing protein [Treponema sp.]
MDFVSTTKSKSYRRVVQQVCDAIMVGELHIGDALPPERELATRLEISRTSVREGIRVLADAGIVTRRRGGGGGTKVIADVIPVDLLDKAIELSHKRITDLIQVRGELEMLAAEIAAARADAEDLRTIDQIIAQASDLANDHPDYRRLYNTVDVRFHLALSKASRNDVLYATNQSFARQILVATDMIPMAADEIKQFVSEELSSMIAVVRAVKNRDPAGARRAMAMHLAFLLQHVDRFFAKGDGLANTRQAGNPHG